MLELHVVQAEFGDALIVRYATRRSHRTLLVDGGPTGTYPAHLRGVLRDLVGAGQKLDLVVLSHIDNDHVKGLLDLFAELQDVAAEAGGKAKGFPPAVTELWHNAFSVSAGGSDIAPRVREALASARAAASQMRTLAGTLMGVSEGDALAVAAISLGVPINAHFGGKPVLLDKVAPVHVAGMTIDVLGPSSASLAKLREEWLRWLKLHGRAVATGRAAAAIAADTSIPNLSSIVLLIRAGQHSMLLTGDSRADQIIDGLRERGLLDGSGVFHVSLLKVPHHGSSRNASEEFFRMLTADRYVISANGRYGNPDLECLVWIVDAAAGRPIEIICTNPTESLRELVKARPPDKLGYQLTIMAPTADAMTVALG